MSSRHLLVFTKPARPGRVKTRLHPVLEPDRAAALHGALLSDLLERLDPAAASSDRPWHLAVAWALDEREPLPDPPPPALRQQGADLGERLFHGLAAAARGAGGREGAAVAAVGSDHPGLDAARVAEAFDRLDAGADVVFGPSADGGYYLVALAARAVSRRLFEAVPWSTDGVLETSLERAAELGLTVELLPEGWDVDRPGDLERLVRELEADALPPAPRTRRLLVDWGRLAPAATPAATTSASSTGGGRP